MRSMHLWSKRSVVLQVFVKSDLLKFVDGNILMDIDVPTVLVILLPLDALSYEEAFFVSGTNLKVFSKSSHDFLLKHVIPRHKKIIYEETVLHELVGSWHCYQKQDP